MRRHAHGGAHRDLLTMSEELRILARQAEGAAKAIRQLQETRRRTHTRRRDQPAIPWWLPPLLYGGFGLGLSYLMHLNKRRPL